MDERLQTVLAGQLASRFAGFSGSDATLSLRITDRLLNDGIAAGLPPDGPVRSVEAHALAGDRLQAIVTLRKPAFLPALHVNLQIDPAPLAPQAPVLVLRIVGGAGGMLKMAAPLIAGKLPPGVRLQGDVVEIDVRAILTARGDAQWLDYVRGLQVTTEDAALVVHVSAHVP